MRRLVLRGRWFEDDFPGDGRPLGDEVYQEFTVDPIAGPHPGPDLTRILRERAHRHLDRMLDRLGLEEPPDPALRPLTVDDLNQVRDYMWNQPLRWPYQGNLLQAFHAINNGLTKATPTPPGTHDRWRART